MVSAEQQDFIQVEVVYALPAEQRCVCLSVAANTTALEAVTASGMMQHYPELVSDSLKLGIFSQPCHADTLLRMGDRVEIYRPLRVDPMEARRRRAEVSKARAG